MTLSELKKALAYWGSDVSDPAADDKEVVVVLDDGRVRRFGNVSYNSDTYQYEITLD